MGSGKMLNSIKAGCIYGVLALLILLPLFFIPGCEKKNTTGPGLMMAVNPTSLRFVAPEDGPSPAAQPVEITSPGGWSVDSLGSLPPWLEVTPTGGANGKTVVNVRPNGIKLEPGTHYAKIILKCRAAINSPRTVDVVYKVLPNDNPSILLSDSCLSFSAKQNDEIPPAQTFTITNQGGDILKWNINEDCLWLHVSPTKGMDNATITVGPSTTDLPVGTHECIIEVVDTAAENSPETLCVNYTILSNKPHILLSAYFLSFRGKQNCDIPPAQTFTITNPGGGVLKWNISEDCLWLDVSPMSGAGNATITVRPNTTNLPVGTHETTIEVVDTTADNSPETIYVSYTIEPNPPDMAVTPTSLNFTSTRNKDKPDPESFTITNRGGGTLNWLITVSADWLRTSSEFGSNQSGTSTPITVYVDTTTLTIGTHEATITVSSPDSDVIHSPQQVKIKYELKGPHIVVDSTHLHFYALLNGQPPPPKYFHIRNDSTGTLCWSVSESADWLDVDPRSGQGYGEVEVSITKPPLESGTWVDTIWVHSCPNDKDASNSPQMVIVNYKVQGPKIELDKDTLYFTATYGQGLPNDQSFIITNIGGGTLEWKLKVDQTWLELTPLKGSTDYLIESSVKVDINTTNPGIGEHVGIITVTSNDEEYPSVELPVIYTIDPPPHIELSEDTLRFVATQNDPDPLPKTFIIKNGGGGKLNWHVTVVRQGTGWSVSVDPTHDLSDSAEIKVSVSPTTLPIDVYEAQIIVGSFNADNEDTVIVIYTITPEPPYIEVDSASLSFSAKQGDSPPPPKYFRITNTGGSVLIWHRKTQNKWLNLVPPDGSIDPGKFVQVKAEITTTDLPVNKYSDKIEIICEEAPNSPQTVDVTYKVEEP